MPPDERANPAAASTEAEAADAEDTYRLRVTDSVLSELVGISDDSDFSMALSLQTGGFLVSGVLISLVQYFRGLAGLIRDAESGQALQEALRLLRGCSIRWVISSTSAGTGGWPCCRMPQPGLSRMTGCARPTFTCVRRT